MRCAAERRSTKARVEQWTRWEMHNERVLRVRFEFGLVSFSSVTRSSIYFCTHRHGYTARTAVFAGLIGPPGGS